MPVNRNEIISLATQLSEAENLKVTVTESAKGACIVGVTAFTGGVVGGPVGLAVGGMLGSFLALAHGKGKYRSAVDVILFDMTPTQQQSLANSIHRILQDLRIEDLTLLLPMVLSNNVAKELVIKEIIRFVQVEMNLAISR